ncbi:hypothetical protein JCM11641_000812, partial [Rhodosporidiobolus odoratus]
LAATSSAEEEEDEALPSAVSVQENEDQDEFDDFAYQEEDQQGGDARSALADAMETEELPLVSAPRKKTKIRPDALTGSPVYP